MGGFCNIILWFNNLQIEQIYKTQSSRILTKEGSRQLLTSQSSFQSRWVWPGELRPALALQKACAAAALAAALRERLRLVDFTSSSPSSIFHMRPRRWQKWITYVVESFWQWIGVSKHERLALPFLLPALLTLPAPSPAPTFPLPSPRRSHRHCSPLCRYITAMCGSSWVCELGAKPHLRHCAEGADCAVTSFSLRLSFDSSPFSSCEVTFSSCSHMLPTSAFAILLTGYCVAGCVGGSVPSPLTDRIRSD